MKAYFLWDIEKSELKNHKKSITFKCLLESTAIGPQRAQIGFFWSKLKMTKQTFIKYLFEQNLNLNFRAKNCRT